MKLLSLTLVCFGFLVLGCSQERTVMTDRLFQVKNDSLMNLPVTIEDYHWIEITGVTLGLLKTTFEKPALESIAIGNSYLLKFNQAFNHEYIYPSYYLDSDKAQVAMREGFKVNSLSDILNHRKFSPAFVDSHYAMAFVTVSDTESLSRINNYRQQ